jgi:hypothetical protein
MISRTSVRAFAFVLAGGILAVGCKSQEDEKLDYEVTTDSMSQDVKAEITSIRASIPSPTELTAGMAEKNFKYNKDLMTSSSKSGSLSSNFQKAAAMGAYGADLGYAASYNQSQDVIEYFGAVSKLAKDLGLESAFDEELVGKIKENMGKKDTLVGLIDRAFNKAERHMRSNQRVSLAAVMAAGGWVEGIYISSSLIKEAPKDTSNTEIYDRTWNHVYSFKNVINLLTEYKSNADAAKMLDLLKDFQPYVDKTNRPGGGTLTQEDVKAINAKITEIRGKIMN